MSVLNIFLRAKICFITLETINKRSIMPYFKCCQLKYYIYINIIKKKVLTSMSFLRTGIDRRSLDPPNHPKFYSVKIIYHRPYYKTDVYFCS